MVTLLQNACVIIVFAYLLTRSHFFNDILEQRLTAKNKLLLTLLCGLFSIYGTIGGMEILGGIANTRDLGPAIAGLLAGPLVGLGAGIIGGVHRFFLGGFTVIPCTVSTVLAGLLAGLVFLLRNKKIPSVLLATSLAAAIELMHMGLTLLLSRPFAQSMAIVEAVILPMVLANALGMAIFFFIVKNLVHELKTKTEKNMIEGELRGAREIQMSIVPHIYPAFPDINNVDLCARLLPAKEVGGDLYDYYLLDEDKNQLFFMVGDVSDKGVPASLFMIITMTLFKANTSADCDLAEVVEKVNNQLAMDNDSNMFVTLFCGILTLNTGELTYVNAGHNPPLLVPKSGQPEFMNSPGNLVLGAMPDIPYKVQNLVLSPDDVLLVYTDGVTEAFNPQQELYSEQRLTHIAGKINTLSAKQGVNKVFESVHTFAQGANQSDDITMLFLRYQNAE